MGFFRSILKALTPLEVRNRNKHRDAKLERARAGHLYYDLRMSNAVKRVERYLTDPDLVYAEPHQAFVALKTTEHALLKIIWEIKRDIRFDSAKDRDAATTRVSLVLRGLRPLKIPFNE